MLIYKNDHTDQLRATATHFKFNSSSIGIHISTSVLNECDHFMADAIKMFLQV